MLVTKEQTIPFVTKVDSSNDPIAAASSATAVPSSKETKAQLSSSSRIKNRLISAPSNGVGHMKVDNVPSAVAEKMVTIAYKNMAVLQDHS